ncbi:MAG: hypothetical protein KDA91_00470 [Planctomycetaceae bacterium]|nr:hypothetical protein [Planctomycetaceae bacterium]
MPDAIDEFESIFRRAEKQSFEFADIPIESVTIVTDGEAAAGEQTAEAVRSFVRPLQRANSWRIISGAEFSNVKTLLEMIDTEQTDLIVTYRHLHERDMLPVHSLGVYLDMLTQTTSIPVLVLPGLSHDPAPLNDGDCDRVMIVADHISGDNRLINYGVKLCRTGGSLWLCHVEDDRIFQRYAAAIRRIPELDSDDTIRLLESQLLHDARQFLSSCEKVISTSHADITVHSHAARGHHLQDYRRLIHSENIDLLVMNTKDDDQLAMNGRAYSMSVELTDVPMLLL